MTTQTRDPVSFDTSSGTWNATTVGTINDYPDTSTYLTHGTTAGNATWNIDAPTIPAGSTSISVSVLYYRQKTSSSTAAMAGRIKVGANYYNGSTSNPTTSMALDTETWATNPAGGAWTADAVNSISAIGVYASDASPTIRVASVRLSITYTCPVMAADVGTFTLTGEAASLKAGRKLTAAYGSFALAGQDVTLTYTSAGHYTLTAGTGTFTLTGEDAGLRRALKLAAAYGTFTLSGQDVTLTYVQHGAYTLTAAYGSFTLTGQDTTFLRGLRLPASVGTFTLTGQAANLKRGLRLVAALGTYTLTGEPAGVKVGRRLSAAAGTFTLSGQQAGMLRGLRLVATYVTYTLTGSDAALVITMLISGPGLRPIIRQRGYRRVGSKDSSSISSGAIQVIKSRFNRWNNG